MISTLNRYKGALLGLFAGDALGAPYETWKTDAIRADFLRRGGLVPFGYPDPFGKDGDFPAGRPTDDTEMAAALAMSLLARNGSDPEDQFARYKDVVSGTSTLWSGRASGFGRTTKKMLAGTYAQSRTLQMNHIPSNGALMRIAPVALFHHGRLKKMMRAALDTTEVTHLHPLAGECSAAYVLFLDRLLAGVSPARAWHITHLIDTPIASRELKALLASADIPHPGTPDADGRHRGAALLTLHIAVWALFNSTDFESGIRACIEFGGDTDTYAAVAGALLGAHYGVESIPKSWLDCLQGGKKMEALAVELYRINHK